MKTVLIVTVVALLLAAPLTRAEEAGTEEEGAGEGEEKKPVGTTIGIGECSRRVRACFLRFFFFLLRHHIALWAPF